MAYLEIEHLRTYFQVGGGFLTRSKIVRAVDDVSLSVDLGETFGLVGESGCGKSSLGRTVVRINTPTAGTIRVDGRDVTRLRGEELKAFRRQVQYVFQDPYASLNPRMTVGEILREPMEIHGLYFNRQERDARAAELLRIVGLKSDHLLRYPHEFSGGQRQRICIARTLALDPRFIICDEPISALDVSIQAQIINLLEQVRDETGVGYLFIAHDIGMVKHISDRIGVMYLGHLVEVGSSDDVYFRPLHPYTKALLSAIPIPDPEIGKKRERIRLEGELPSPIDPPSGCPFRTRCPYATAACAMSMPELKEVDGRTVACHLYD